MGKFLAGLIVAGGCILIRAFMYPSPPTSLIIFGLLFFIVALVLFLKEFNNFYHA